MCKVVYRKMCEADVLQVSELEKRCFRSPWSYEALKGELTNSISHYEVATIEDEVVGYAGMWTLFDEAHMTNIAVAHEHRKKGIGARLLLNLMRIARGRGAARMTLEVRESNYQAQRLYAALGFGFAGIRKRYYTDTGENAFILWNNCINDTLNNNSAVIKNDNKEEKEVIC